MVKAGTSSQDQGWGIQVRNPSQKCRAEVRCQSSKQQSWLQSQNQKPKLEAEGKETASSLCISYLRLLIRAMKTKLLLENLCQFFPTVFYLSCISHLYNISMLLTFASLVQIVSQLDKHCLFHVCIARWGLNSDCNLCVLP